MLSSNLNVVVESHPFLMIPKDEPTTNKRLRFWIGYGLDLDWLDVLVDKEIVKHMENNNYRTKGEGVAGWKSLEGRGCQ